MLPVRYTGGGAGMVSIRGSRGRSVGDCYGVYFIRASVDSEVQRNNGHPPLALSV